MENLEITLEETKNKIVYCLKKTYTEADDVTRLEAEFFLQQKMKIPEFWDILLLITNDNSIDGDLKRAAIVFIEKHISFLISTKSFEDKMTKFVLGYLYKCLDTENLPLKAKLLTRETITKIGRFVSKLSFEVEETWEFYCHQFINKYKDIRASGNAASKDVFSVVYFISSFFDGVHDICGTDILFVYDFMVEIAQDMFKLIDGDRNCQDLAIWETVHAYLRIIRQYIALIDEEDLLELNSQLYEEKNIQEILLQFLTFQSENSKLGKKSLLMVHENIKIQEKVNLLRIECMGIIFGMMELLDEDNTSEMMLAKFQDSDKKVFFEKLAETIMDNLALIANLKDDDLRYILEEESTNDFVYTELDFIHKLLKIGSFYQFVSKTCKVFYLKGLMPLLITRQAEIDLMQDEPIEMVSRAEDLVNYQRSEIPKNKANSILEILCENVDGMLTYCTNICLKMFQYSVNDVSSEEISSLMSFEIYKNFTKVQFMDLALIQISNLHINIFNRGDLSDDLKNFLMENLNKLINIKSNLIHLRLMMFLGIVAEDYFCTLAGSHFLEIILKYLAANLVNSKDKALMLTSINCMTNILTPYVLETDDEDKPVDTQQLMLRLLKPLSLEITKTLVERCIGNFEKDDDILEVLEYILRIFSHLIVEENPQYISTILHNLSKRYKDIVTNNPNMSDSVPYKYLGLIKLITRQPKVIKALDKGIELSIEPILVSIHETPFKKFTADVLQTVQTVTDLRQSVSPETFQFFSLFINKGDLRENRGSLDSQKFKFLNSILHYGRNSIVQDTGIIKEIIDQINNQNDQESFTSKIFSMVAILENYHSVLDEEYFKKIMENSFVEDNTINFNTYRVRRTWIALAGFYLCPAKTLKVLEDFGKLDEIVRNLIMFNDEFKTPFSTKLYIFGLVNLMRQDILHPVIATKPIKIIESLIDRLKDASRNNNSEAPDRKDSDDEDFNVFDDDFKTLNLGLSNVDEYAIYDELVSGFKDKDEFLYFREFILSLRDKKPQAFQAFLSKLREAYKKRLARLVDYRRVVVDSESGKTEARRVVKIRRRKR